MSPNSQPPAAECLGRCGRPAKLRGLCRTCYQATHRAIKGGRATEQQLLEAGLLKPKRYVPRGRMAQLIAEAVGKSRGARPRRQGE